VAITSRSAGQTEKSFPHLISSTLWLSKQQERERNHLCLWHVSHLGQWNAITSPWQPLQPHKHLTL